MKDSSMKLKLTGVENMKRLYQLKAILVISGLILAGVGGAILFMPVAFSAGNGFDPSSNVSLLNEFRSSGGAVLASGIVTISGAFVARLTFTAVVISILMYLSYGISRILSMAIDGMPADGLVNAAVVEISVGFVVAFAYLTYRGNEHEPDQEL